MLRLFPVAALLVLIGPVAAGLAGMALPAFGYLPVLGGRQFSLEPFRQLVAMPGLVRSAALSLGIGVATTAIAFAVTIAFVAGWRGTRAFAALERFLSPLLSVPHAAAAFGLAFLIAPSGMIVRLLAPIIGLDRPPDLLTVQDRSGLALCLGLVVKEIPFLFLMTLAALPQARASEMERMMAALGYGRIAAFVHGVMPLVYRQIRLAVLAVLAFSASVVDVALILGPTTPAPLAVRVLQWQHDSDLGMHFVAAAGALLQVGIVALALLIWLLGERVAVRLSRLLAGSGERFRKDGAARRTAAALMSLSAGFVCAGILLLAIWSFAGPWRFPAALPETFTLENWMRSADSLDMALRDTLAIAATASLAAIVLALGSLECMARYPASFGGRWLRALYIPLIVPQVSFLFGLEILFSYLGVNGAFAAVVIVHLVFVFPYVLLSLADPWRAFDPRYGHVVRALGRGPGAVFWLVRLPMLARPVLTAAALGFAVSVALYLPTLVIGAGRWPTITTEAVALASGGNPRLIGVTALLQAALPFAGFAAAAIVLALLFHNRRLMRASS